MWPMFGLFGLAAIWHVALITTQRSRRYAYIAYAIVFLPIFYVAVAFALIPATHFPL